MSALRAARVRLSTELPSQIVSEIREAGGGPADVLYVLESLVAGLVSVTVKPGGEATVLDVLLANARTRIAEFRTYAAARGLPQ